MATEFSSGLRRTEESSSRLSYVTVHTECKDLFFEFIASFLISQLVKKRGDFRR